MSATATAAPAKPPEQKLDWYPAKDNPMFPPEMTALLRFARTRKGEPRGQCAYCGKKPATRWTMLCPFKLVDFKKCIGVAKTEPRIFQPLELVCDDHPLHPEIDPRAMMCAAGD